MPEISCLLHSKESGRGKHWKRTMNSIDLQRFIDSQEIEAEILLLESPTPTVAAAAEAISVRPDQIIKSVLFLADGHPVLVIANGLTRIHRKRLADVLEMSRRRVKMGDGEQVQTYTGFPIGAVPPFGHPQPLETLLDEGVLEEIEVFGGGGETYALMRVAVPELRRVTGARIVAIAED
jgi:prolyl-tRNA editing enzyme YbaK/EbsC (Cys-tRNA(Pro) deacylase)